MFWWRWREELLLGRSGGEVMAGESAPEMAVPKVGGLVMMLSVRTRMGRERRVGRRWGDRRCMVWWVRECGGG